MSCATEGESCKDKYCCNGFLCNGEVCKKGIESVFEYRTSFIIIIGWSKLDLKIYLLFKMKRLVVTTLTVKAN